MTIEQSNINNNEGEVDLLQQALAELEQAIQPLENDLINMDDISNINIPYYLAYLYLMWAEFHVYFIEPFAGSEDAGSGIAKIIPIANGRKIFDYGFALSTSVGEDYASYSQGKLYQTIQEMIAIAVKRNVKKVSFIGNSLAMRVAWLECVEHQIETVNYEPGDMDFKVRERLRIVKEKAKKLKPGQELRF